MFIYNKNLTDLLSWNLFIFMFCSVARSSVYTQSAAVSECPVSRHTAAEFGRGGIGSMYESITRSDEVVFFCVVPSGPSRSFVPFEYRWYELFAPRVHLGKVAIPDKHVDEYVLWNARVCVRAFSLEAW